MRFFHLGDLHFGKMLHNVPLIEEDQPFWVEKFLQAVDKYGPDAVVIAGDVYDRRIPSPEAMRLFDHLLTELARRDKFVFVIPGNHDSSVRLSHVGELLKAHRIFIAGEPRRELLHVTVPCLDGAPGGTRGLGETGKTGKTDASSADPGNTGGVTFWMMPYIFPKLVSDEKVLGRDDLATYDEAARALLAAQDIDTAVCNVLVAHQNVLANGTPPQHSESETLIGGLGEIDYSAFDSFDYVALGHIHNAQRIGRDTVRYSGCPLYYDFSEIGRDKGLTLVTVNSKEDIAISRVEIPMKHTLLQLAGTLEELLAEGAALDHKEQYYVQCILRDRHVPPRALEQLRDVFGDSLINVKRELTEPAAAGSGQKMDAARESGISAMSLQEQFGHFFQEQQNELLDGDQEALVEKILEQQSREGADYVTDAKSVPLEDSQELLDFLLDMVADVTAADAAKTNVAAAGAAKVDDTEVGR